MTIKRHKILILSFYTRLRDCEKLSLNEWEEHGNGVKRMSGKWKKVFVTGLRRKLHIIQLYS